MSMLPLFNTNPRNHHHRDPFATDIWDRLKELHNHHESMLAQHAPLHQNTLAPLSGPTVEWSETPEAHMLRVELPGFRKEEVKVKVKEGRFLKISGKKKIEKEERHENGHHYERSKGKFSRGFTLPENSRADDVRSHFDNGVLTITIPKRDVVRSHVVRNVRVKG